MELTLVGAIVGKVSLIVLAILSTAMVLDTVIPKGKGEPVKQLADNPIKDNGYGATERTLDNPIYQFSCKTVKAVAAKLKDWTKNTDTAGTK